MALEIDICNYSPNTVLKMTLILGWRQVVEGFPRSSQGWTWAQWGCLACLWSNGAFAQGDQWRILAYMIKLSCVASLTSLHGIAWTDSYHYCRKQTWKHFFLKAPNESYWVTLPPFHREDQKSHNTLRVCVGGCDADRPYTENKTKHKKHTELCELALYTFSTSAYVYFFLQIILFLDSAPFYSCIEGKEHQISSVTTEDRKNY